MLPLDRSQSSAGAPSGEEVARLRTHRTLGDLVQAGVRVLDVVIQDEFSHDVVVRAGGYFAVYEST